MSDPIIAYRGTVYPWQCDHMGHMNTMWYAGRFDEASWQLLSVLGLTAARLRNAHCGMAAIEQQTRYLQELHPGDPITVRSRVLDLGEKAIRIQHEMTNDERREVAATSVIVAVHFDTTVRKSRPFPEDVRVRARRMIVPAVPNSDETPVTLAESACNEVLNRML